MISKFVFLAIFVAGLAAGVYTMLHGIERHSKRARRPSAIFNAPIAGAFAIVFGAVGYLLVTRTDLSAPAVFLIAGVAAVAMTIGAVVGLSYWALPYAGSATDDDSTQGTIAVVTRAITPSARGEISFQSEGVQRVIAAESLLGTEIPVHSEVVIDTIDDGVAQVESWSSVEQRL